MPFNNYVSAYLNFETDYVTQGNHAEQGIIFTHGQKYDFSIRATEIPSPKMKTSVRSLHVSILLRSP